MLFGFAIRAIYIESCCMFVCGGVYRFVREALGATIAKFSVSALAEANPDGYDGRCFGAVYQSRPAPAVGEGAGIL